jgi:hypothetical protein
MLFVLSFCGILHSFNIHIFSFVEILMSFVLTFFSKALIKIIFTEDSLHFNRLGK